MLLAALWRPASKINLDAANILNVGKKISQYLLLPFSVDGNGLDVDVRTVSNIEWYSIEVENNLQENQDCNAGTTNVCLKNQTAGRYLAS